MYERLHQYFKDQTDIGPEAFDMVCRYFEPVRFKKNELVLRHGEICRHNYFVNTGCLRFFTTNAEGQEMTRYFAFEGKFGTALSSFIEQKPSFEYIQSMMPSEVLRISGEHFYNLTDTIPQFNLIYRKILEMAYVTSQKRIYGLQGDTALERLRWLMSYQPKILAKLSNKVVASYLGVTPYTLSRLKADL